MRGDRRSPGSLFQPYLGIDDGLATAPREQFTDDQYAGIEIELNNRIARLSEQTVASWHERIAMAVRIAGDRG